MYPSNQVRTEVRARQTIEETGRQYEGASITGRLACRCLFFLYQTL
jgi:hypothetical protein